MDMETTEAKKVKIKGKMCGLRWSLPAVGWLGRNKNAVEFCAQNGVDIDFDMILKGVFKKSDHTTLTGQLDTQPVEGQRSRMAPLFYGRI